ncbi:MAG: transferrin-binding protein-like solute binding protein [Amphritea sp.]
MNKYLALASLSVVSASLFLTGCGGGGGGGANLKPLIPTSTFTSFSAISPPEEVTAPGISTEADYSATSFAVTSVDDLGVNKTSSAVLTFGSSGSLEKVTINTPNSTVTWSAAAGDMIDTSSGLIIALENAASTDIGIFADAVGLGWNYQTFGSWVTGFGSGSGKIGAISSGAPSAASAIPVTGIATFSGLVSGIYVDSAGEGFSAVGDLTVGADFTSRILSFTTTNTQKVALDTAITSTASNLNMIGALTYNAGINSFTGSVTATGLTGTADGQFYGPEAQELGGVFTLRASSSVETFKGGFGAAQ